MKPILITVNIYNGRDNSTTNARFILKNEGKPPHKNDVRIESRCMDIIC